MLLCLRLAKPFCEQVHLVVICGHKVQLDCPRLVLKNVSHEGQSSSEVFGLGATVIPLGQSQR